MEGSEKLDSPHATQLGCLSRRQAPQLEQLGRQQKLGLSLEVSLGKAGLEQYRIVIRDLQRADHALNGSTGRGLSDQPPYTRFFAKLTPSAAQKFGIEREIATARGWLVELARSPNEPLAQTWTPKVKEATDALEMAFLQRNDAVKALAPLQTSVVLLIDDVNRELDRLEGDLKKLFPGQPDRVASYLAELQVSGTYERGDSSVVALRLVSLTGPERNPRSRCESVVPF